jgi:hypothetical protein
MKNYKIIGLMVLACCLLVAAGAQAGPLFGTSRNVDIVFDGFCDGLHMNINYNNGKVVATRTGTCVDPEQMVGSVGALGGKTYAGGAVTLMNPINGGFSPYYAVIKDNPQTWIYYLADGSVLNHGTYSVGVPAAAAAKGSGGVSSR